jgi:putative peptidoglycan lipid II flippase
VRVHPGDRIDGRYLVYEQVDENWGVCGWRAHDEVLGRDVLLTTFHPEDPRGPALVEAARAAAGVPDHRFIRILDAQIATPTGFLVREWVGGRTLADAVGGGPLPEAAAAAVARDVAEAVAGAHAAGIAHLCIDPSTVILADDGAVRIRGLGTAAVLRGVRPGPDGPARDDTVGVGRVLYAGLTARSTEEGASDPATGLPLARRTDTAPPAPRQVRAGVSPMLDAITVRALGSGRSHRFPPYQSPREVARALARVSSEAGSALPVAAVVGAGAEPGHSEGGPRPPAATRPALDPLPDGSPPPAPLPLDVPPLPPQAPATGSPRWLRRAGVVAAVALGAGAVLLGMELLAANRVPDLDGGSASGGGRDAAAVGTPQATDPAPDASVQVVAVRDFDPLGNGSENAEQTAAAIDGSPATVWRTQTYYDPLEQQKAGVGLLLDLGREAPVGSVEVVLDGEPSDVQVRLAPEVAATPPATQDGFTLLGSAQAVAGDVTIRGDQQTTRYVLVWFTRLPPVPDGWRGGVAEVTVRS